MEDLSERYAIADYSSERMAAQGKAADDDWRALTCYGLAGESGEVIELVKKQTFHGRPYNRAKLLLELGDVLWYVTFGAHNHADIGSLHAICGCTYFDEFEVGYVASRTSPAELSKVATGHLIVDVGKFAAKMLFNEPWQHGSRELRQHLRGVIWAISALAHINDSNLEEVARLNNEKLRERYPHGFSVEAAQALHKADE